MNRKIVALVVAAVAVPFAGAQSLTTLFAANNSGSFGGAVYFDVTVGATALTITGFDTNTNETAAFTNFQVWTRPGTANGFESSAAGWTMVATGSGTGAGLNNPTAVTLSASFNLNPGLTGMALVMDPALGHDYTNGPTAGYGNLYSNSDLTLGLGAASNVPFSGSRFIPRMWNGTIYYTPVPEPATMAVLGLGAAALLRRRRR